MSTLELKKKIKNKLADIDDKKVLEMIYQFMADREDNSKPYRLTEGQIAGIKSGLADVKAGRVISNEDFEKEMDQWLAKAK